MSQWGPSSSVGITHSQEQDSSQRPVPELSESLSADKSEGPQGPLNGPGAPVQVPWWAYFFPFCLSAFFFLSAFLIIFSPLPILFLHIRRGRKWAWSAAATNTLLVGLLGGASSLIFYAVWVLTLSLLLPELLIRKKSIEFSVTLILLAMVFAATAVVVGYSQLYHLNLVHEIQSQISGFVDYLGRSISVNSSLMSPAEIEEWKRSLLLEFPSAVAIFSLILVWANLVLLLRANPSGLRERMGLEPNYLKCWKAPLFLVWPTIVTGFFLLVDGGVISDISLNLFKFLMAIYAIQGLSILTYYFDMWSVRGVFRLVGFSLSLFLMMPLVLSLGFFDLWFDFRSKFRQS